MRPLHRESFDTDAIIEQVGRDPLKLCAWVGGQTQFVPYQGLLRGPRGVLMDRVGSDLDRAILLARLVISSGYEVRLARLTLAESEAIERLKSAAGSRLASINDLPPAPEMVALFERAAEQSRRLGRLVPASTVEGSWNVRQLQAASDHWWVQYMDGRGWVDLDPTLPQDAGKQPSPAHRGNGAPTFFACALPDLGARIPADQFHRVEFSVVIERWQEGRLVEETDLTWAIRTWDDPSIHLYLFHGFDNAAQVAASGVDAEKLKNAALTAKNWRPILQLNGRCRGPKTFDENGVLSQAPVGGALAVGNAVRSGFGALGQSAADNKPKPNAVLTAEWLDITVTSPGHAPQVIRREVFDSLGPSARASAATGPLAKPVWNDSVRLARGFALAGSTDHLVASSSYPMTYVCDRKSQSLLNDRQHLVQAVAEPDTASSQAILSRHRDSVALDLMNCARGLEQQTNASYIDRPNVCRLIAQPAINANGKAGSILISDLAANSTASLGAPAEAFSNSIRRGVVDTLCERIAVGNLSPRPNDALVRNTADAFDRAGQVEWVVLRDPAEPALVELPVTPDVRARIVGDLRTGNIVVISKKPAGNRFAWWRISAATGQTVGVMDTGRCADDADYSITQIPAEDMEMTLAPRGKFMVRNNEWGPLAEQIVKFRGASTFDEIFACWEEAFEVITGQGFTLPF